MQRRDLLLTSALLTFGSPLMAKQSPQPSTDALVELPATALADAMQAGRLTSVEVVDACLARIAAVDRAGPRLNSVIELNPDAREIARLLDEERRAGRV